MDANRHCETTATPLASLSGLNTPSIISHPIRVLRPDQVHLQDEALASFQSRWKAPLKSDAVRRSSRGRWKDASVLDASLRNSSNASRHDEADEKAKLAQQLSEVRQEMENERVTREVKERALIACITRINAELKKAKHTIAE